MMMVSTASENGLFDGIQEISLECILNKIKDARDRLEKSKPPDFSQCDHDLSTAADYYFKAVNSAPKSWRFLNIYAIHIWIYLIAFLCLLFIFYYELDSSLSTKFGFLGANLTAIYVIAWGVIGGILRGLWWLWHNVNKRQYRKVWIIWFISTPFLGGILGAIAYLLIFAGLMAVSEDKNKIPNSMLVIVTAALAGFNWEWIVERFNRIKEKL
jgi:hypothetical protein